MLGPGGPLHEMGVETQYTESIAVLLKRMSSRMWDYSVSGVAVDPVDRARQWCGLVAPCLVGVGGRRWRAPQTFFVFCTRAPATDD